MKETTFKHLRNATFAEKTSHRITKVEKSGKIVANQGIGRNDEYSGLQLEYGMKERFKYLIRNLFLKL